MILDMAPLGKSTKYLDTYCPDVLYPVSRSLGRDSLNIISPHGCDIWRGWELSWLNPKGKPVFSTAEFCFPSTTPNIVESKSFKLYLNSFNQTSFESIDAVKIAMEKDLSNSVEGQVAIKLGARPSLPFKLSGVCLDSYDIVISTYEVDPKLLKVSSEKAEETLHSHLLKSNCLATSQPDWGTVFIRYSGNKIDHESLLKYIISYRKHSGFAEHCVEKMYNDIMTECRPEKLYIAAAYTRRGGLDINPIRANFES